MILAIGTALVSLAALAIVRALTEGTTHERHHHR